MVVTPDKFISSRLLPLNVPSSILLSDEEKSIDIITVLAKAFFPTFSDDDKLNFSFLAFVVIHTEISPFSLLNELLIFSVLFKLSVPSYVLPASTLLCQVDKAVMPKSFNPSIFKISPAQYLYDCLFAASLVLFGVSTASIAFSIS